VLTLTAQAGERVSPQTVVYLNRLSDLLFVLARAANAAAGEADVEWQKT
jgi:cob(I)alamin adenosyltransferase